MRRALSALSIAAIAIAIAVAPLPVAAAERSDSEPTTLALIDSARDQLTAMRIDPNLAAIQTGIWNYAGPNCPGAGWTCTDAPIAIQLGVMNQFECTGDPTPDNTCVIVQVVPTLASGNNYARCFIHSDALVQSCSIDQTNAGTGENFAEVNMIAEQSAGAEQTATQTATVTQKNGGSLNRSHISQTILQTVRELKKGDTEATQTQDATQTVMVCQGGPGGCTPASPTMGNNVSALHQLVHQDAFAMDDMFTIQTQDSDIDDDVVQSSLGTSHSAAHPKEVQIAHAKNGTQIQSGPVSCCGTQFGGNENNTVAIEESTTQQSDGGSQSLSQTGTCVTDGNCHVTQTATNDSASSNNHCSDSPCTIFQSCSSSTDEGGGTSGSCTTDEPEELLAVDTAIALVQPSDGGWSTASPT